MKALLASLLAGFLFGVGLLVSGMTQPAKVIGFLDVAGGWDPSLAFVMLGAIGVHFLAYRLVPRMREPMFAPRFKLPTRRDIDAPLVAGAALFGAGWGLGGYCPGPALTSAVAGAPTTLLFTASMLVGMGVHTLVQARGRTHTTTPQGSPR